MKIIILIAALIFSMLFANAQHFDKSVGFRLGHSPEFYFDKENDDLSSYRLMAGWRDGGRQLSVMKIFRNYGIEELPENFSLYYGYGVHAGTVRWNQKISDNKGVYWDERFAPVLGLNAMLGLSYDFTQYPISLTCDVKPYFDFWGARLFRSSPFNLAFGVAYHF